MPYEVVILLNTVIGICECLIAEHLLELLATNWVARQLLALASLNMELLLLG